MSKNEPKEEVVLRDVDLLRLAPDERTICIGRVVVGKLIPLNGAWEFIWQDIDSTQRSLVFGNGLTAPQKVLTALQDKFVSGYFDEQTTVKMVFDFANGIKTAEVVVTYADKALAPTVWTIRDNAEILSSGQSGSAIFERKEQPNA